MATGGQGPRPPQARPTALGRRRTPALRAVGETVTLLPPPLPSMLKHLPQVEGGAVERQSRRRLGTASTSPARQAGPSRRTSSGAFPWPLARCIEGRGRRMGSVVVGVGDGVGVGGSGGGCGGCSGGCSGGCWLGYCLCSAAGGGVIAAFSLPAAFPLPTHCLPPAFHSTFFPLPLPWSLHCLCTAFPWPSTAFPLPFPGRSLPLCPDLPLPCYH